METIYTHNDYLIAWICALPLEMAAAKAMLDATHPSLPQPPTDHNTYTLGRVDDHAVVIACLPYGVYGTTSAATVVAEMRSTFPHLQFGLMVGIGGGVPGKVDIRLGDVVVSKPSATSSGVIQYDYGKTVHGGRIERIGSLNKPHPTLLTAIAYIESDRILGGATMTFMMQAVLKANDLPRIFSRPENDSLFFAAYSHKGGDSDCLACDQNQVVQREPRVTEEPHIHYGLIASGNQVMKDSQTRDKIAAMEEIICFEMEAAGLMDQLPCLVIRGICDYCDSHKNKQWQGYAALTAAAYARILLSVVPSQILVDGAEARKRIWMIPFPRNPRFVGREDEITQIQHKISNQYPPNIALTGLGGVGKTQIATELAYRVRETDQGRSVFWISFMSQETIEQGFMNIAEHLKLKFDDNPADVKMRVKSYLSRDSAGQWLLICDNADDMDTWDIKDLKSSLPRSYQCHILFTTRNRKLAQMLAPHNMIVVPDIDERTAEEIFQRSLLQSYTHERSIVTTLLQQLTFLPLAITQAAAYINSNGIGVAEYVDLLQEQEHDIVELLSEDFEDEGRYTETQNPVATTWLVSFNQIKRLDSLAAEYLSFMACVDPRDIPRSLLPSATSKKRMTDALGLLSAYSFVTLQKEGLLSLHRLVHLATRSWIRQNSLFPTVALRTADRFEEVFPDNNYKNRSLWREYLPHAIFLMKNHILNDFKEDYVNLVARIGDCLHSDGRYNEAEELFRETLHFQQKRIGTNHPDVLNIMRKLASTYRNQGLWRKAEELDLEVVRIQKEVLGTEHPSTLTSMVTLASTYWSQGQLQGAEELSEKVVEMRKIKLGPEHPDTLVSITNLGSIYQDRGRWKEAEELFQHVLEFRKTLLGNEHPDTLVSMAYLSSIYRSQSRWNEAERLEVQVAERRKIALGADHPETLTSVANLASIYQNRDQWKEAGELFHHVVRMREIVLGLYHPNTLMSMSDLASVYQHQGAWNKAKNLFCQVIERRKTEVYNSHPMPLRDMMRLADLYREEGRWKDAESVEMQILQDKERVRGIKGLSIEYPEQVTAMANLALIYRRHEHWEETEYLQTHVMEWRKTRLGTEKPDTLTSMADLALTWNHLGKIQDAISLMNQCVQLRMTHLGADHPDTVSSAKTLRDWEEMSIAPADDSFEIVGATDWEAKV